MSLESIEWIFGLMTRASHQHSALIYLLIIEKYSAAEATQEKVYDTGDIWDSCARDAPGCEMPRDHKRALYALSSSDNHSLL